MGALFGSGTVTESSAINVAPDERRQLTVLFYDIVGSTEMFRSLDAEDIRDVLLKIHALARSNISANAGSLEQVLGDGGMAYFGYPKPTEDAVFQAVRAACGLLEARARLSQTDHNLPDIRLGIATSVVVLPGDSASLRHGALGAVGVAPNLAARLQAVAPKNSALVDQTTHKLTHRAFEFDKIEDLQVKGFPDVGTAWSIVAQREVHSRLRMARDTGTPLIARDQEARMLAAAWDATRNGTGQALLLEGEAGIGKSRLAEALENHVSSTGRILQLQCQPSTRGEALYSLIEMYERAYKSRESDHELGQAAVQTAELVHRLENDLSQSPDARRKALVDGCVEVIRSMARLRPCLMVIEDLHWADEVTLAVLERMADGAYRYPVLMLATSRPGAIDLDEGLPVSVMQLNPLSPENTRDLARSVSEAPLTEATLDWIVEKSDGNPLFAVELTEYVVDSEEISQNGIPRGANVASLRDLLATRLDTSGRAKRTAQIASVIGRDAAYSLLVKLAERQFPRAELEIDLDRLVQHGIHVLADEGSTYSFRHVLVRDAAYDSQLRGVTRSRHAKIVDLARDDPALAALIPREVLAEHCFSAGRLSAGIDNLIRAAELALRRSSRLAPRKMLERVMLLSEKLEDDQERRLVRLRVIMLLGPLITLLDGPHAATSLYEHGQKLCFDLEKGERGHWFPVLWGWWFTADNLIEQTRRSEVLIRDITTEDSSEARLQALHCGWATLFDGGAHERCLAVIDEGLELYDPLSADFGRYHYGHDAKVCGLGERAQSLWMQGNVKGSLSAIKDAEEWASRTGHVPSILHALDMATLTAFYRRDINELNRVLGRISSMSGTESLPVISAKKEIFQGWTDVRGGNIGQSGKVLEGLKTLRRLGALEDAPIYADIAAGTSELLGDAASAVPLLDAEIKDARSSDLLFWLPELLRRRALLGKSLGEEQGIVSLLDEGLELSVSQNAHMLLLRNVAARVSMGLPVDERVKDIIGARIGLIDDCSERTLVADALGL